METSEISADEDIPVLKVSYEQFSKRVDARRKPTVKKENEKIKDTQHYRSVMHQKKDDARVRVSVAKSSTSRLAANILKKQSLDEDNSEGVWREAWSQWNLNKKFLDKIIVSNDGDLSQAIAQCVLLEDICSSLFTNCTELAIKNDLISKVWRTIHYPVIDVIRKQYKHSPEPKLMESMKNFYSHLMRFYGELSEDLQRKYDCQLSAAGSVICVSGQQQPHSKTHQRKVRQAINVVHQCFIFLGDISRYNEGLSTCPQWSKPRSFYLKSVHLLPKNGQPYNLLAVIAINSQRRLDAVYYYIRSLCSKNVFLSANEALTALFDETARKAKALEAEKKLGESKLKNKAKKKNRDNRRKKNAATATEEGKLKWREIWIMPGSIPAVESDDVTHEDQPIEPSKVNTTIDLPELLRKLINGFLIAHGKLFSRIGIETFDTCKSTFLDLLKAHLHTTPSSLTPSSLTKDSERFIMMTTINIFSIHQKISEMEDNGNDPFICSLSLSFGLDFITTLMEHVIPKEDQPSPQSYSSPMVLVLLPSVRVWLMWLTNQVSDWYKLVQQSALIVSFRHFLCGLSVLLDHLNEILVLNTVIYDEDGRKLWEDKSLAGFTPLGLELDHLSYPQLSSLTEEQHLHQCAFRITDIVSIATTLAGNVLIPLVRESTGKFTVTMETLVPPASSPKTVSYQEDSSDSDEDDDELGYKDNHIDEVTDEQDVSDQLQMLKLEKDRLSKQMNSQLKIEQTSQLLLKEVKSKEVTEVIIKPKYLVPDTNCFIDHLNDLIRLIDSGHFVVAVPLVVLNELDGLSKGRQSEGHEHSISQPALSAAEYMSAKIGSPYLKTLTAQGNLLPTLNITTELTDKATNDDLILSSCIRLYERVSSAAAHPGYMTVVLLTDDRNLRVKSHASHMPVKNPSSFMNLFLQK